MDETMLKLLVDLHLKAERQGPGSDAMTRKAIDMAGLAEESGDANRPLQVADIGCGTGASAFVLAEVLGAEVTAVDFLPDFLAELERRAAERGLSERIRTLEASMEDLPFEEQQFDVIWSEGAVYNMGFEAGVRAWRRFLKPGGWMVLSEITWLTAERPMELEEHWAGEYPEIGMASDKFRVLEKQGFSPVGYAVLPEDCWMDHYYDPMKDRFDGFLERYGPGYGSGSGSGSGLGLGAGSETDSDLSVMAREVVEAERKEMELYEKYKVYVSYGMYVARKV